jgi:hypothetical protein
MTWTTVLLIAAAWFLVSVVAGLAFAFFFGGMNRIHPDEIDREALRQVRQDAKKAGGRVPPRPAKPRHRAGAAYRPVAVGGAADPHLDDQ